MSEENSGNVKVICRFRPLNEKEKGMSTQLNITFPSDRRTVHITPRTDIPQSFTLDHIFTPSATQTEVYQISAEPIVEAVMQGFNGTVFAYGQTSSGKTFTMAGPDIEDPEMMGIIPRMVNTVFDRIRHSEETFEYSVKVAYAEIYLEKIRDLIEPSKNNLRIHEDRNRGVYIADLTETYVAGEEEVFELMRIGTDNREVAYTDMNAGSSRSHSLFMITISQTNTQDYSAKTGKLYLIDLAGSEKVGKTGAEGKRLEEAKNINKSLTVLGQVINALTDGKSKHIPYRDSKLTRVLQDSLGGNSKTSLIVTCSPSPYNEAETISTLRFGIRAKTIKNKPKVNREYTVAELKLMLANAHEEISKRDSLIRSLTQTINENGIEAKNEVRDTQESNILDIEKEEQRDGVILELEEVRNRLSEEVSQHSELKKKHTELHEEYLELLENFDDLKKVCEEQKLKLSENEDINKENLDMIENLTFMKESLQKELEETNSNKLSLEQELNSKEVEIEQLSTKIKKYNTDSPKVTAEPPKTSLSHPGFEEANLEIDELKRQLTRATGRLTTYQSSLLDENIELNQKNEILERNLDQLALLYHQIVNNKSQLKVNQEVLQRKIARLTQTNKDYEKEITSLKEQISIEQNNLKTLADQLHIATAAHTRMSFATGHHIFASRNIKRTIKGGGVERVLLHHRKSVGLNPFG